MVRRWPSGRRKGWESGQFLPDVRSTAADKFDDHDIIQTFVVEDNRGNKITISHDNLGDFAGSLVEFSAYAGLSAEGNFRANDFPKNHRITLDGTRLSTGDRGVILSTPVKSNDRGAMVAPMDPRDLRFALLLWDFIDFPTNTLVRQSLDVDEKLLSDAGLLRRSKVAFDGEWSAADCLVAAQYELLQALERVSPSRWALLRDNDAISAPAANIEANGLSVALHRALPIPDGSTPLEDVLVFREKRRPELLNLREHLDAILLKISSEPNRDFTMMAQFDALDKSIADYLKASKESKFKMVLSTLISNITVDKAVVPLGAAYAGFQARCSMADSIAAAGTTIAALSGAALKDFKRPTSPFEYVARYHDELRWS